MTRNNEENPVNVLIPARALRHRARRIPAVAVIAAASALTGLAGCASAAPGHQPAASGASSPGISSTSSSGPLSPPVAADAGYKDAAETRIAGSLHLTAAQVRAQLRANPGSGLENLAKPLGLAEDQLGRIILSGLDQAASQAAGSGRWTAGQAQAEKMYWARQSYTDLVTGVSSWFVNA
jgi:hypothetical protein